jgi:3'-phosphoadenosine 5'-phosphosulfate sulfotransferase (PAPS reductase)/FAD synthetase
MFQPNLFASPIENKVAELVARGALFVCNHSAGKDSQAMFLHLKRIVPAGQLIVIHAVLPEVEWDGLVEHIEETIGDTPLIFAHAVKTFFDMVEHRRMFPSPANRQCTSDLKRGPIEREIRRYLKAYPEHGGLVVNCMGMRAQESPGRAKLEAFKINEGNSKAGREWYDWLPVHDLSESDVFEMIADAGEQPLWVYAAGMKRASCCFCIMSCEADLKTAARLNPSLYQRYADAEQRHGFTLSMNRKTLPEITGVPLAMAA